MVDGYVGLFRKEQKSNNVSLFRKEYNFETINTSINNIAKNTLNTIFNLVKSLVNNIFNVNDYESDKLLELSNNLELLNKIYDLKIYGIDIDFYNNILSLTKKTINYYLHIENLKLQLIDCDKAKEIINDITLLYKQIEKLKKSYRIIPDQEVTNLIQPIIKSEYIEYIKKYGYPQDGVFDFNKI